MTSICLTACYGENFSFTSTRNQLCDSQTLCKTWTNKSWESLQNFERRFTWSEESQQHMKPFLLYIAYVFSRRSSCDAASTWHLLETSKRRPKRNSCFTSAMIKHNWAHCTVHVGVPSTLQWATLMPQYATHTVANCCYPEMLSKWLVAPHVRWASEDTHRRSSTLTEAAQQHFKTMWETIEKQHVSRLRNT